MLPVLYSIRSERMLMEQLDYNLLFRWFVGLSMDDGIWDATVFTKNRDRLLRGHIDPVQRHRWPYDAARHLRGEPADEKATGGDLRLAQDGGDDKEMRHRGVPRADWVFAFALAAYNLVRIRRLIEATA